MIMCSDILTPSICQPCSFYIFYDILHFCCCCFYIGRIQYNV